MKNSVIKKGVILFFLISLFVSVVSAADVAYITKNVRMADKTVLKMFNESGLSVDVILNTKIASANLSKYRFVYLGDERFPNRNSIPVNKYNTLISNYYYGADWGLTDKDGISKLASTSPLKVEISNGNILQVYDRARVTPTSGASIDYYYLGNGNRLEEEQGITRIATTYSADSYSSESSDLGDVIEYIPNGTKLKNGLRSNGKICFFGVAKTAYWTEDTKKLFKDCVNYLAIKCSNNSECDDGNSRTLDTCVNPGKANSECKHEEMACLYDYDCGVNKFLGNNYCFNDGIARDYINFTCNHAGTNLSFCSNITEQKITKICDDFCLNGQCMNSTCHNNSECSDGNDYTEDLCLNPGKINATCQHKNITCLFNSDCGTDGIVGGTFCDGGNGTDVFNHKIQFTCNNAGTVNSTCSNSTISILNKVCKFGCFNGECNKDNIAPVITLVSPQNNFNTINSNVNFVFNVSDDSAVSNCSLILDGSNVKNLLSVLDVTNAISFTVALGDHNWKIVCTDAFGNTGSSLLRNLTIQQVKCSIDSDCGSKGFIGSNVCDGKAVKRDYLNFTCNNAGTTLSFCSNSTSKLLVESCPDFCLNGQCKTAVCHNNAECGDGNSYTEDVCVNAGTASATCQHNPIICLAKSDCGSDEFIGNNYCSGKDVVRDWKEFSCNNAGTVNSVCSFSIIAKKSQTCADFCTNGQCNNAVCHNNSECDDSNVYTEDLCLNPGTVNSECKHNPIACKNNADCGSNGFTGEQFCSGKDVFQNYLTFNCNNAGTSLAYCTNLSIGQLKQTCSEACKNGNCANIICSSNAECNDNNAYTEDICLKPGTVDSSCSHKDIVCFTKSDCGTDHFTGNNYCDGNIVEKNFVSYTCNNAGTSLSSCSIVSAPKKVNECEKACFDGGVCVECNEDSDCFDGNPETFDVCFNAGTMNAHCQNVKPACKSNADCGSDGFIGSPLCSGKSISQLFMNFNCINPNSINAYCTNLTTSKVKETCANACLNGECKDIVCKSNAECNDNNAYTEDLCLNPGTVNSECKHNPIVCLTKADCGSDGLVGQPTCSGKNVVQNYLTNLCNNAGTSSSTCSSSSVLQLIQSCPDYCLNGECKTAVCHNDAECDDGKVNTQDTCVNAGTASAICQHNLISCMTKSDCGTDGFIGNNYCSGKDVVHDWKEFSCNNAGTSLSFCSNSITPKRSQTCVDMCLNGNCVNAACHSNAECNDNNAYTEDTCVSPGTVNAHCEYKTIKCLNNADCGSNGFTGEQFCSGKDVFQNYLTFNCNNAGTINSVCSSSNSAQLKQSCSDLCLDGNCIASCTNKCTLSEKICSGNGYQICRDYNGDGCTEWGGIINCGSSESCSNGNCIASCTNACVASSRTCSGNGYQICRDYNGDGCTEWSLAVGCSTGKTCSNGYCK